MLDLKSGSVFLDLGAHKGREIECLVPRKVRVISYEPHPWFFSSLKKKWSNVPGCELHNKAVSNYTGTSKLFFKGCELSDNGGASLLKIKSNVSRSQFTSVSVVAAHDAVDNVGCFIDVMKMNVEGSEYDILWDLIVHERLDKIGRIYVEDHKTAIKKRKNWMARRQRVFDTFKKMGRKILRWELKLLVHEREK